MSQSVSYPTAHQLFFSNTLLAKFVCICTECMPAAETKSLGEFWSSGWACWADADTWQAQHEDRLAI